MNMIRTYNGIPISGKMLMQDFHSLKSPENRIQRLVKDEKYIRLKKNLYIDTENGTVDSFLAANYLVTPSYVSGLSALSYYGVIPEAVFDTISMTTKRSQEYNSKAGHFTFVTCPKDYFPIGINVNNANGHTRLIAGIEKAVCDHILMTPYLNLRYKHETLSWLEDEMRMDMDVLSTMDLDLLRRCSELGRKRTMINNIIKIFS